MKERTADIPLQYLKGIGPKRAEALAERGLHTVRDLLYYFPFGYIDLGRCGPIAGLRRHMNSGEWVTAIGWVRHVDLTGRPPRQRLIVTLEDESGTIPLLFFRSINYFKGAYTRGELLAVSGKVTGYRNQPQLIHPSVDRLQGEEGEEEGFLHTGGLVPKYGSSEDLRDVNLHVKGLRRIMKTAVEEFADTLEEYLPEMLREELRIVPLRQAIRNIHFPPGEEDLRSAQYRLKFDELFGLQLLLALRKTSIKEERPGIAYNVQSSLARSVVDALPFALTQAQRKVIKEIAGDMKSPRPMNRLLQGDVGSGKTIVALLAMLVAVDNGYQVAFMAPTEILAEQHWRTIISFIGAARVNCRLLTGGQRSRLRKDVLEEIREGRAQVIVGTHALFQEGVEYARLGLVVVDEQHRFGVAQRLAMKEKALSGGEQSVHPDVLVMTATPIPRTLSLTLYGDLDVSVIDMLPGERKPVQTGMYRESQMASLYSFIRREVSAGRQVYVVYPLIEESEKVDLKAATERYHAMKEEIFSDLRVDLLHGRMESDAKESVMSQFKEGKTDILVSTTVIEVGIDVPNASVMVIEHAERFGLSQLHQLRGRVGRGAEQSYCLLVVPDWLAGQVRHATKPVPMLEEDVEKLKSVRRIATMLSTTDGFKIAEIDLELRGPGEFFGTRQSGLPELQIANLITDGEILTLARRKAFELIGDDPHLRRPEHVPLRKYFSDRWKDAYSYIHVG